MSILVDRNIKVVTQGMTGSAWGAAGARVDSMKPQSYFTHNPCKCGAKP
jgi:hypothetical protein